MNTAERKQLEEKIVSVLTSSNYQLQMKAVGKALVHLLSNQTSDEERSEYTKYHNGIGFTPADAPIATSMAKWYASKGFLTPKQLRYWTTPAGKLNRPRILKYRRQLLEFAMQKQTNR